MNQQDRGPFAELLCAVSEVYREPISDPRMELYFSALADLELPEIRAALNVHVRSSEFFPKPADIRRAIQGTVEDRSELAWVKLLRMVRHRGWTNPPAQHEWDDPAMRRAALELYGGWQALCENLPCEGVGLAVAAKQFKATYAANARVDQVAALVAAEQPRELSADEARSALAAVLQRPENAALLAAGKRARRV